MKKIHLIILCFFFCQLSFSQTAIGLEIGLDYSDFRPAYVEYPFLHFKGNEAKGSSIKYGILGEHQIKDKWLLLFNSSITKKKFDLNEYQGFNPLYAIDFLYLKNSLIGRYAIFNSFFLDFGYGANFLFTTRVERILAEDTIISSPRRMENSLIFGMSYKKKNFFLSAKYYYGLSIERVDSNVVGGELVEYLNRLQPFRSIDFSIGYLYPIK